MQMAQEMEKAGIIQEMTEYAFQMLDDEDLEDEVDEEVDKVVMEILGPMPDTPIAQPTMETKSTVEEQENPVDEMEARLAALA